MPVVYYREGDHYRGVVKCAVIVEILAAIAAAEEGDR
jgi:hypothetical protein